MSYNKSKLKSDEMFKINKVVFQSRSPNINKVFKSAGLAFDKKINFLFSSDFYWNYYHYSLIF